MTAIDLNADIGEGMGDDIALLDLISSASIACGGHAGDGQTMRTAVRAAKARRVRIGAHPGFIDRENFGRRRLMLERGELSRQIRTQVAALAAVAKQERAQIAYVKLHGALANMAAEDVALARTAFEAAVGVVPDLAVLAIDNSEQVTAAEAMGLVVLREAYGDRAYTPLGLLVSRSEAGAVIEDPSVVADRCVKLARTGKIDAIDGSVVAVKARSICLHGDTPGAMAIALEVRAALQKAGIVVAAG